MRPLVIAPGSGWTSLEITKLAVAALTPILVAGIGVWLNRRLKSIEQAQWARQKVIERRIKAYDELALPLNELFCFFCYVGTWKELTPHDAVKLKRHLDQTAHTNAALFDRSFLPQYNAFMDTCFATFGRWGEDAKLKTLSDRRMEALGNEWRPEWSKCFATREQATEPEQVKQTYARLMVYLAEAIGAVEVDHHLLGRAATPGNFDMRAAGMVSSQEPPGGTGESDATILSSSRPQQQI